MPLSDFHESMKGWTPVETSIPSAPSPSSSAPMGPTQSPQQETPASPYLRTTIPLPLTYQPDTLKQHNRPGMSSFRISPLPPSGIAAVNAAIQSGAKSSSVAATFSGMNFRGVWNSFTAYSKNDVALFNTSAYVAVQSNTNQEPDNNTSNWTLLSENLVFKGEWISNAPSLVQFVGGVGGGFNAGIAVTKVLAANTKGNVIIVYVVAENGTLGTITVSDSNGNSYTQLGTYVDNAVSSYRSGVFAAVNIKSGANTVSVTYSNNTIGSVIWVAEYATTSVSPVVSFQGNAVAAASNSVTLTTTDNSTVLLFYNARQNLVVGSLTPPAGFVLKSGSLTAVGGIFNAYFNGAGTVGAIAYPISSTATIQGSSIEWGIALQTTPTISYHPSDVVEHLGSTYVCILATGSEPTTTNTTHWYKLAQGVGYATSLSGNYSVVLNDSGRLLTNSTSSAYTVTLLSPPPLDAWVVFVQNAGTGTTIISPNGLTLDGSSASITLAQNQGTAIFTDGLNYFTERGFGTPSGGVNSQTIGYTAVLGDSGKLISMNGSSLTLTLPAAPPATNWWIAIENTNASSLTVSRNGLNIDGAASNITLRQNQGVIIYTDGSNYFTERGLSNNPITGSSVNLAAQGANKAATTILAVVDPGIYRISVYLVVSRAATTTSTLPDSRLIFTDQDSGTSITVQATNGLSGNTLTTFAQASYLLNVKTATNIQYDIGQVNAYASSGATSMQFAYRARVEYLG